MVLPALTPSTHSQHSLLESFVLLPASYYMVLPYIVIVIVIAIAIVIVIVIVIVT